MVYYPDKAESVRVVRVGWLDKREPFTEAETDPIFAEKLLSLYRHRTNQTRGFHLCPFCKEPSFGVPVEVGGQVIKMGSAEIHLKDSSGRTFIAPDLIYHYVVTHRYKPPREFIEAVCSAS